jgi:lactate dehydrogenase-like 2-hydroxyacid dehydrogenase
MTSPTVCVCVSIEDDLLGVLSAECQACVHQDFARDAFAADLSRAEALLCISSLPVTRELISSAPRLRVISTVSVGFDHVDVGAATERGIVVCNTPGVLTDAVADYTMLLILELARGMAGYASMVRDGRWANGDTPPLGFDLAGKTLGIVGYGRIGRAVADRARAFGMRIIHYDVVVSDSPEGHRDSLDDLLREADIVSLHVNLTPRTAHLIGARELRLMKPSAYLVNTARGGVVDQAALVDALRGGVIAGAALDVLEREPCALDDPILALPNVLVLPHAASATRETRRAMRELAVRNLLAVLRGEAPECCVNPEVLPHALAPGEQRS